MYVFNDINVILPILISINYFNKLITISCYIY